MTIIYKYIDTEQELNSCLGIRHKVFILEQDVPENEEIDGLDGESKHVIAEISGEIVATLRIRFVKDIVKIERVAVLENYRGQGIGRGIMDFIIADLAQNKDISTLKLSAQTYALPFYEDLGFQSIGDEYMDANIPHFDMIRDNR